jgi:hypothetical protein
VESRIQTSEEFGILILGKFSGIRNPRPRRFRNPRSGFRNPRIALHGPKHGLYLTWAEKLTFIFFYGNLHVYITDLERASFQMDESKFRSQNMRRCFQICQILLLKYQFDGDQVHFELNHHSLSYGTWKRHLTIFFLNELQDVWDRS